MKPDETADIKIKYFIIMILCFLYGGYAIIVFLTDVYAAFWRHESFTASLMPSGRDPDISRAFDANRMRGFDLNRAAIFMRGEFNPIRAITSPISLSLLVSGIISIAAGLAIWGLMREKEIKAIKQETADNLLLPDEKKVIGALKRSGFESTQKKLSAESGLSRVQAHRVIKKLEAKGILEKHDYGMTNKIILKKELFE